MSLTRDFEKIRKQVSRRRTHVPEWMRVVSLLFFVVAALYLGGMYIHGTLQGDNEQTAATSFDDGIGGSVDAGVDVDEPAAPVPDGGATVPVDNGGPVVEPPDGAESPLDLVLDEPQPGLVAVVSCEDNQTTSLIPQSAYGTAEQSVVSLFTGDYAALIVAADAAVPDITQDGFVLYENPLVLPGCLYATGDVSYAFLFAVDPDGDGPVPARRIRTIVEHDIGGPRWVGY